MIKLKIKYPTVIAGKPVFPKIKPDDPSDEVEVEEALAQALIRRGRAEVIKEKVPRRGRPREQATAEPAERTVQGADE